MGSGKGTSKRVKTTSIFKTIDSMTFKEMVNKDIYPRIDMWEWNRQATSTQESKTFSEYYLGKDKNKFTKDEIEYMLNNFFQDLIKNNVLYNHKDMVRGVTPEYFALSSSRF